MTTPTDPLYPSQWHFNLIGDIETIWDEFTGAGVNVAVYDDGLEYTHPDLAGNYNSSLHFKSGGTTYDPMPISSDDAHGTACAGIIGAIDNNGTGGVGVAHGVTLTGVNFLSDIQNISETLMLESIDWARNFDVMSNSWGISPTYDSGQSLLNDSGQAKINVEYGDVVEFGRGGLGTVIVQASGNETSNANGDGLNVSRYTATIAATESTGFAADYSNFGSSILIAAPAAAVTTDLTGSNGYDPGDYTDSFNGTSAATPVVAGVVSLMLEANEDLGWRDVQNILAISASQTGSNYGSAGTGTEVGSWGSNGAGNWNGGGNSWHQSYGFGMVDAFAAVRMAEIWGTMFGEAKTSANEQTVSVSHTGGPLAIPDAGFASNGVLDVPLEVTENIRIEDIAVTVRMQHSNASDLVLTLIGPNGEQILLMNREGGSTLMDFGFEWQFGVTGALDMLSAGTWTLRITDTSSFFTGSIDALTIDFFGSAAGEDDVYHFTQDLFDLINIEPARATITDNNGGTDWLNFAAMGAIAITVNLNDKTVAFSSTTVELTLAGDFENVALGDGNDIVVGNDAANTILGMRGNDNLQGAGGNDDLRGNDGNDILSGGLGVDRLTGGSGQDEYRGTLAEMNGDTITDYQAGEQIVITDALLEMDDITITAGSTIISIDEDGDGVTDSSFTLTGTFIKDGLTLTQIGTDSTALVFDRSAPPPPATAPALPDLSEMIGLSASEINGMFRDDLFIGGDPNGGGTGPSGFVVKLDAGMSAAAHSNTLGVYEIDAAGNIVDVRLLVNNATATPSAEVTVDGVEAGNQLGFFMVSDGASWAEALSAADTLSFIDVAGGGVGLAVNGVLADETVFHSNQRDLNPDGREHVVSGVMAQDGPVFIGFEDLLNGGDNDFQDIVFSVEEVFG